LSLSQSSDFGLLAHGARVQVRVIGALIIRELQSRFGRHNIGFLWFLVEPMLLAGGVTVITYTSNSTIPDGLQSLPFHVFGYITYMLFRTNANRAASVILSNRVLMYHRHVTMPDLLIACSILELGATFLALVIFIAIFAALGLSPLPERPLLIIGGMMLMFWFTTALAMMICAAAEFSHTIERFVHPFTYLTLPFSGMLFRIDWLPPAARDVVKWFPLPQITEIVREGVWGDLHSDYIYPFYLIAVCSVMTLFGLLGLRLARRRVRFE
jgi:capsular polysaccharide transport system permease protein